MHLHIVFPSLSYIIMNKILISVGMPEGWRPHEHEYEFIYRSSGLCDPGGAAEAHNRLLLD